MTLEIIFFPFKLIGISPRKLALKVMEYITIINLTYTEYKTLKKSVKNRDKSKKIFLSYLKTAYLKSRVKIEQYIDLMETKNYDYNGQVEHKMYVRRFDYAIISVQILLFISIILKG